MIEPQNSPQPDASRLSQMLSKALVILGMLLLAAIAIGLGGWMGRRIWREQWPILVTATGLATYIAISLVEVRHGLLLWVVTAPFAHFVHLDLLMGRGIPDLTLNRIMAGVLLILVLAQIAIKRRKLVRFTLADVLLLAFCGAAVISVPSAAVGFKSAIQGFFDLIMVPVLIYFLARNVITTRQDLQSVMIALLIIGVYFGFLATKQQLTGVIWFYPEDRSVQYTRTIRRVVELIGNPAFIAVTIGMAVPWVWYLLLTARRGRLWWLAAVVLMMAGIFFCMNRSGWVGLVVALAVMAFFVKRFRRIFLLMLIAGTIAGVMYWALITASATFRERLQAQGPIEYRVETWDVARRMIMANPIFGIGWENFQYYYKHYARWDIYLRALPTPHNTYLWVILMGGIVAFIPFITFLGAVCFSALSHYRQAHADTEVYPEAELAGVFLASLSAILVPAFVMDVMTGYYNTMILFFIMGSFFGAISGERQILNLARMRTWRQALLSERQR